MNEFTILSGTANRALADGISRQLKVRPGACAIGRFPDGEVSVRIDDPLRGREVFVIQPTCPPVDAHLVELLAIVDACRRASARRVTVMMPYFGYARSDKRGDHREPINASMVALLLQAVGVDHVVTIDLHATQVEGFFHIPLDNVTALPLFCTALKHRLPSGTVVVSPDSGRMKLAIEYAHRLATSVVVLHKQRGSGTETEVVQLVGDVRDRPCLIIDDMISTGGTVAQSIETLLAAGARPEITVVATHGLLLAGARKKLSHPALRELMVTDTVPLTEKAWPQLRVLSVAPLLASAIERFVANASIRDLFLEKARRPVVTEAAA